MATIYTMKIEIIKKYIRLFIVLLPWPNYLFEYKDSNYRVWTVLQTFLRFSRRSKKVGALEKRNIFGLTGELFDKKLPCLEIGIRPSSNSNLSMSCSLGGTSGSMADDCVPPIEK